MLQQTQLAPDQINIQSAIMTPIKQSNIEVEKDWKMDTPQGNQAMKRKAESLVKNLDKVTNSTGTFSDYVHAFEKYLNSYQKGCATKTCGEAKKKKVQKVVWNFLKKSARGVNIHASTLDNLWSKFV